MIFNSIQTAIIYIFSIFFMSFFCYLYRKKAKSNILLIIGMLPIILLATFRLNVGTDFSNYQSMFNKHNNMSFINFIKSGNIEVGYYLLNRLGGLLNSFNITLFLSAIIIVSIPIFTVKNNNKINLMLFAMLISTFYFNSFNIIRQSIAISIAFNAMYNLITLDQRVSYIIKILLASLFHISALFLLPFIVVNFLKNKKLNEKLIFIVIFILVVVVLNFNRFINVLSMIPFLEKYLMYEAVREGNNYTFYLVLSTLIVVLLLRKYFYKIDYRTKYIIYLVVFEVLLTYLGFEMIFVKRIASYFEPFRLILLSIAPLIVVKRERILVKLSISLYAISIFILSFWILGFSDLFPYQI